MDQLDRCVRGPRRDTVAHVTAGAFDYRGVVTPDELAQRRPVWDAMSDLFLDTEVRFSVPSVVRTCATSHYSLEQLDRIFWVEVFPLAIGNLLQVAGEWGLLKLDEAALVRRAEKARAPTVTKLLSGWMVAHEWAGVQALVEVLRSEPHERWPLLEATWRALGDRYFELPGTALFGARGEALQTLSRQGVDVGREWARYAPIAERMLLSSERASAAARAAEVTAMLSAVQEPHSSLGLRSQLK
jgi:hypothetical protein